MRALIDAIRSSDSHPIPVRTAAEVRVHTGMLRIFCSRFRFGGESILAGKPAAAPSIPKKSYT